MLISFEAHNKPMANEKFTTEDRKVVVAELEAIQKTKLMPVNSSRRLFTDERGMLYLFFGGTGDWHGMRPNTVNELRNYNKEGALIIAKKYRSKIDICVGPLSLLIRNLNKFLANQKGDLHFHTALTEDGMYVEEAPDLRLNIVATKARANSRHGLGKLEEISKIINIEVDSNTTLTHSDLQAKLILIGSYLGYRTYTPDKSKSSVYGVLGKLCSEKDLPEGAVPNMHVESAKFIDVIWFDEEGFPTHGFEVEHTTDITKGMLRLYQVHKLRIKMFIIASEESRGKFQREVLKSPFSKIREEYLFKNYEELDEFFNSVRSFTKAKQRFLSRDGIQFIQP